MLFLLNKFLLMSLKSGTFLFYHNSQLTSLSSSLANPTNTLAFPLRLSKNVAVNLNIKSLVGNSGNSTQYQVFEVTKKLPKFYSYMYVNALGQFGVQPPTSVLTFYIKERIPRVRPFLISFIYSLVCEMDITIIYC